MNKAYHVEPNEQGDLVVRRAVKTDRNPVKTPAETVIAFTDKLKPRSDIEVALLKSEQKKREQAAHILSLQATAHTPTRQWKAPKLDRAGAWGQTEDKLLKRIGTGFLIGLIGIRGNGKTQLAVELIRYATEALKPCLYASMTEFFIDVKSTYRDAGAESERDVIKRYRRPMLLVLDEAGQRAETEWENRMLFELLNKRYADCKDTLVISNQNREEFRASIGDSLNSRMIETGGIIECKWNSFRNV